MTKSQERYLTHKLAGICTRCGQNPATSGKVLCQQCREKAAEKQQTYQEKERERRRSKERFKQAKQTRTCAQCHRNPATPGKTTCEPCTQAIAEAAVKRKETRLAQGLCASCGEHPALPGKRYCEPCQTYFHNMHQSQLARNKAKLLKLKSQGICVRCKKEKSSQGHVLCDACRAKDRDRYHAKFFTSVQNKVMERDGHRCLLCGIDRKLVVHHIDGQGKTSTDTPNDDPANLITLCVRCHACITHLTNQADRPLAAFLILSAPT